MSDEAPSPDPSAEIDPTSSGTSEPAEPGSAAPTAESPSSTGSITEPKAESALGAKTAVAPAVKPADSAPATPRPNYLFLGLVSIVTLALDLGSKVWAKGHLEDAKSFADRHIDVIPKLMSLTFARNKGGAWGLLQEESESVRRPFFFGISLLAVIFIVSLYRRLTPDQTALKWGLPLVLGGALGNLVNRIQYNFVVDFIDVYAKWGGENHHWPTFNIADVAIVAGVGLMAIDMFTSRKPVKAAPVASAEEAPRAP